MLPGAAQGLALGWELQCCCGRAGRAVRGCHGRLAGGVQSMVRMADFIVVLDGARVAETGTHEELMARAGQYAELYGIQAAAYR